MKLAELADHLGATLHGDPEAIVTGLDGIETAGPGHITFVSNPRYAGLARTTKATAVIVEPTFPEITTATLRIPNPYLAFARTIELFYQPPAYAPNIHPTAVIAPTATIGANAHIGACVVISDHVTVGENAVILPHVVLYPHVKVGDHFFAHAHAVVREYCQLGDHVTLQNGAIIGADGFGFAKQQDGTWYKIIQSGPTVLEDRVEVQANSTIDRATIGETRIRSGVKVDNLVQVGHGSDVGSDTLLCAQVGLAGSSTVGKSVILAGQVGVVGHSVIGDNVVVTAQSGVPGDVPAGSMISGSPAFDHRQWLRAVALFSRLPDIVRKMRQNANQ